MQNPFAIAALATALVTPVKPQELKENIAGITADVTIGKTIEVKKVVQPDQLVFRDLICNFSVTPASSTPPSFILAGKVIDNNAGAPKDFVPIFFGSTVHPPHLAALTNVDGEFRFRVWIMDKPKHPDPDVQYISYGVMHFMLRATSMREATLYLDGNFDHLGAMTSGRTHIHELKDFLDQNAKKTP